VDVAEVSRRPSLDERNHLGPYEVCECVNPKIGRPGSRLAWFQLRIPLCDLKAEDQLASYRELDAHDLAPLARPDLAEGTQCSLEACDDATPIFGRGLWLPPCINVVSLAVFEIVGKSESAAERHLLPIARIGERPQARFGIRRDIPRFVKLHEWSLAEGDHVVQSNSEVDPVDTDDARGGLAHLRR